MGRPLRAGDTVDHDGAATLGAFLARRAFYGTTAGAPGPAPPGLRWRPPHVSGWSLAVWTLVLARRPVLALAPLVASIGILADASRASCAIPSRWRRRIAGGGTARAALPSLAGLARAWSPAARWLGLAFRRTRTASALALVLPALDDWVPDRAALDPVRFTALHVADDAAYGIGRVGRLPRSARSSHWCRASRGAPASGRHGPSRGAGARGGTAPPRH